MADLNVFIGQAVAAGTGKQNSGQRYVPAFVAAGQPEKIYEESIPLLRDAGFQILDAREQGFEEVVKSSSLPWPIQEDEFQKGLHETDVPETERRLAVLCGSTNYPRFWQNLRKHSVLYTGAAYPPMPVLSPKCVVVPDCACVCSLVLAPELEGFSLAEFDPIFEYESTKTAWED